MDQRIEEELQQLPDYQRELVTVKEAAEILGVSGSYASLAMGRGAFKRAGKNSQGLVLVRTRDVLEYKLTRSRASKQDPATVVREVVET